MTDLELVDAQRLAEALERLEAGIDPDLDPREDPSLSALVALAAEIRDVEELATDAQRYRSYRERSRDHVLRRIGREALPRETLPAQIAPTQVLSTQIIPTALVPVVVEEPRQRRRPFLHWSYLAPVASAAAAAVAVLAFIVAQPDAAGEPVGDAQAAAADAAPAAAPTETVAQIEPPPGFGSLEPDPPLPVEVLPAAPAEGSITQGSIESELERINQLIGTVAQQVADGAPSKPSCCGRSPSPRLQSPTASSGSRTPCPGWTSSRTSRLPRSDALCSPLSRRTRKAKTL